MYVVDLTKSPEQSVFEIESDSPDVKAQGLWNCLEQKFVPLVRQTAALDADQSNAFYAKKLDETIQRLNGKPCITMTLPNGQVQTATARRYLCPKCKSEKLSLPLIFNFDANNVVTGAKPGKGETKCLSCDYTGRKAKVVNYSMYEFADLVKARKARLDELREIQNEFNTHMA